MGTIVQDLILWGSSTTYTSQQTPSQAIILRDLNQRVQTSLLFERKPNPFIQQTVETNHCRLFWRTANRGIKFSLSPAKNYQIITGSLCDHPGTEAGFGSHVLYKQVHHPVMLLFLLPSPPHPSARLKQMAEGHEIKSKHRQVTNFPKGDRKPNP